jgi:hypothetical protein
VLLNFLCCLPLGHLYLGQSKKAIFYFLALIVSGVFAVGPLLVWVIMQIDCYQLGDRSQRQPVRVMENGIDFLDGVFGPTGVIKS